MPSSNKPRGLDEAEAARRLARHGRNELPPPPRRGLGRIAAQVMTEPMFLLLALAAGAYLVLGEPAEGSLLAGFAVITIGLVVVQERRSERALEALRALGAPMAVVLREGRAAVLAFNKWDLVEDPQAVLAELREKTERLLPQARGIRAVPIGEAMVACAVADHYLRDRGQTGRLK